MSKVKWEEEARSEELKILEYAVQNYTRASYRNLYKKFRHAEINLSGQPLIGVREYYLTNRSKEYRSLYVPKYFKLIYYYDENSDTVFITDVWDTRKEPLIQASHLQ